MPAKVDFHDYIKNCLPSLKRENDWTMKAAIDTEVTAPPAPLPESVDLRAPWWKIGNQSITGSCVGWGCADGILRWHFHQAGKLGDNERLSVRAIWMSAKETDQSMERPTTFIERSGTNIKAALDVARKYGVVLESVLPFTNPPNTPELYLGGSVATFYALAAQRKITSYFNLERKLDQWRAWLANNGPIVTRLDLDSTWYAATQTNGNLDTYHRPRNPSGHCIVLAGYTPTRFIVRNSWGTVWGDKGFGYASYEYAQNAFNEAYGVTL
jgi:hypothetical protein